MDYSSILSKPKSFFGKQKVWMARGEDLALFNTHRPNIQNLLRHSCIPESSHNLWIGLYRVGTTEDEAKTFVVVSCTDRKIRKLTRDILSSCPIFQPGQALDRFKVISKATLPETACEPRQTMQDEEELECEPGLRNKDKGKNIANDEYKTIRISPSTTGDMYLCRQVQARQVSGKGEVRYQTATAGPLISLDGRTYQLTVAHVVNFEKEDIDDPIESTIDDWDDWDEESEDDINSGCSVDEYVAAWDISTSRNSTPNASDDEIPSSSSSSDPSFEVATQREGSGAGITKTAYIDGEPIDTSVHSPSSTPPHIPERPVLEEFLIDHASPYLGFAPGSENCQISTEMDYLLIPTNTDLQAGVSTSKSAELVQLSDPFDLQYETEARSIIIATASLGYVEGMVFPASSLLRPPGSKDFQRLYCIESDNAMPKGTSGSAVFDKRTGLLAGYTVLGCPEKNIWYMVPILDVFNEFGVRFGLKAECQIQLDTTTAEIWGDFFDTLSISQRRLPESKQGPLDSTFIPKSEESHLRTFSVLRRDTRWGTVSITIPSILKGFLSDKPAGSDQWKNQFNRNGNSPESERRLFVSFKDLRSTFLEPMARMLPGGPNEERQMMAGKYSRDVPQAQAWMVKIFEPFIERLDGLDRPGLLEILKQKDLLHDSNDRPTYTPHCLYINNIDPATAMALYKTTSWRPMRGCRELFSTNASYQPNPVIDILQDVWHGTACFDITINLPFFVLKTQDEFFKRSIAEGLAFRTRLDLSFLQIPARSRNAYDEDITFEKEKSYLFLDTWSTIVIGTSERYWTALCLEDAFGERLSADDDSDDKDIPSSSSESQTANIKRFMSPRAYALKVLAIQLGKVVRYHQKITLALEFNLNIFEDKVDGSNTDEVFKHEAWKGQFRLCVSKIWQVNSKLVTKLEIFLLTELRTSPDGTSSHPLWGGFHQDPGALESSQRIQKSLDMLRDVQNQLDSMHARIDTVRLPQRPTETSRVQQLSLAAASIGGTIALLLHAFGF